MGAVPISALILNQRVAKLQAKNIRDWAHTYTLFRQQTIKRTPKDAAKGTVQANLSLIETANMEIQIPPNELLETFSKRATPLLEKVSKINPKSARSKTCAILCCQS